MEQQKQDPLYLVRRVTKLDLCATVHRAYDCEQPIDQS
jgi:hypothetical protein